MKARLRKYVRILSIELEDLADHCEELVSQYRDGYERGEITEHVCFENTAVVMNEGCGIRRFQRIVAELDLDAYTNLGELVADIKERFLAVVSRGDLAPAAYVFAERKVDKVAKYIERPCIECAVDKERNRRATRKAWVAIAATTG